MQLFERVKSVAKTVEQDGRLFHDEIGVNLHTFKGYLSLKRQDNLLRLLPKILEVSPSLSRQWLYFGEGPMFMEAGLSYDRGDPDSPPKPTLASDLEVQNDQLKRELNDLKSEVIHLQKELLSLHRGRRQERRAYGTGATIASGPNTAALS